MEEIRDSVLVDMDVIFRDQVGRPQGVVVLTSSTTFYVQNPTGVSEVTSIQWGMRCRLKGKTDDRDD